MRLWTLHPRYLDARGLVAAWREALLAQAVLRGRTVGYTRHPQLVRFRESRSPVASIGCYLVGLHEEATRRGYRFDRRRIARPGRRLRLPATVGQLAYEWRHLRAKLAIRDRAWLAGLHGVKRPDAHPIFRVVPGAAEAWEVARPVRPGGER
jgi:pyrimidine dimer DNA glycosylase